MQFTSSFGYNDMYMYIYMHSNSIFGFWTPLQIQRSQQSIFFWWPSNPSLIKSQGMVGMVSRLGGFLKWNYPQWPKSSIRTGFSIHFTMKKNKVTPICGTPHLLACPSSTTSACWNNFLSLAGFALPLSRLKNKKRAAAVGGFCGSG